MAKSKKKNGMSMAQKEARRKEHAEMRAKKNRKDSVIFLCGIILFVVLIVTSVSLLNMVH